MSDRIEVIQEYANANGLVIVPAQPNVLQLDIDNPIVFDEKEFEEKLDIVRQMVGVRYTVDTFSRNNNKHRYIVLSSDLTLFQRIAMQAALGSDGKRELLSLLNDSEYQDVPVLCLETPAEYMKLQRYEEIVPQKKLIPAPVDEVCLDEPVNYEDDIFAAAR